MRGRTGLKPEILAALVIFQCATMLAVHVRASESSPGNSDASAAPVQRPNIVLVTVCTFRHDHVGAAGYPRPTTPFLDSLAEGGTFFENAVGASSWTQPSTASIVTGLTPNVHRMTAHHPTGAVQRRAIKPERIMADEIVTLAECLRDAGYATFAQINNVQAGDFFNIPQGFDGGATHSTAKTPQMIESLGAWMESVPREQPVFAFLMTRDAHFAGDKRCFKPRYEYYRRFARTADPLSAEEYGRHRCGEDIDVKTENGRRDVIDGYDGALAQLDHALSQLPSVLATAGRAEDTVIVVTGDHGERFFEKGKLGHGGPPDHVLVHVPLIMNGPGIPVGRRVPQVVRSIDLFPTLANLGGGNAPEVIQGRDLLPFLRGRPEEFPDLSAFASVDYRGEFIHSVRRGNYQFFSNGRLYDVAADPAQKNNLARQRPELVEELRRTLDDWLTQEQDLRGLIAEGATRELTQETIDGLRELGYIE